MMIDVASTACVETIVMMMWITNAYSERIVRIFVLNIFKYRRRRRVRGFDSSPLSVSLIVNKITTVYRVGDCLHWNG